MKISTSRNKFKIVVERGGARGVKKRLRSDRFEKSGSSSLL